MAYRINAVLEAVAAGLPVIALRAPSFDDALDNGVSEFLIPVESVLAAHNTSFGWPLLLEDPLRLLAKNRPGLQGQQVQPSPPNNSHTDSGEPDSESSPLGKAIRTFVADPNAAIERAAAAQRVLAPILQVEGGGGLLLEPAHATALSEQSAVTFCFVVITTENPVPSILNVLDNDTDRVLQTATARVVPFDSSEKLHPTAQKEPRFLHATSQPHLRQTAIVGTYEDRSDRVDSKQCSRHCKFQL